MNEAIRNAALLLWTFCAVSGDAQAAETAVHEENMSKMQSTIIYGASETAPDVHDSSTVILSPDEPNPLGEPIDTQGFQSGDDESESSAVPVPVVPQAEPVSGNGVAGGVVSETLPQNPPINAQDSPRAVDNQIQDTLYESGNRIYDVQSYPVNDINTITQPNTQPTINSYPSY